MFINKCVKTLKPYTLVSHKAWELQNNDQVLKLDWNESTIPPSPKVKENILKFLETGRMNWYPDINNQTLLNELAIYNNIPVEYIQYFSGSDASHEYIVRCFIEPGDRVTIIMPTYDNFRTVVESSGGLINYYYLDDNFQIDLKHFEKFLLIYRPKIVYICNPNNPTGTIYKIEAIEQLITKFSNIMFIVDEAYYEFTNITCKNLVLDQENLIISRTFSKAFGLAGFRIGYVISSKNNIEILSKVRNPKNISTISQIAAISALQDKEYMYKYVEQVNKAKKYFDNELRKLGFIVIGNGGNFSLLKIDISIKKSFIEYLEENYVFVRDYSHVKGMENYVRITIGTVEQMKKVLELIKNFKKWLKRS